MLKKYFCFSFLLTTAQLFSQTDCPCEPLTEINICYLDRFNYCGEMNYYNCGITLNHPRQEDGIVQKILNPEHFGPQGTVDCDITLTSILEINKVEDISSRDCQVLYVGHFPATTSDIFNSMVSDSTLQAIRNWSLECPRNLAIIPQAEAKVWGYTIKDENVNPNSPADGSHPFFAIFDGPFGTAQSFNQGGSYQGVITEFPPSGHTVLAKDDAGRPTIAFDFATSDLIIGDIGYFSVPNAGELTEGDSILSNNDVLATNVFAFACQLVNGFDLQNQNIQLCEGLSFELPGGDVVSTAGIYLDTLVNTTGCDTIVNTQISYDPIGSVIAYTGCQGDGYSIQIESTVYDETNPIGTEIYTSVYGCDSIISIELEFIDTSSHIFNPHHCEEDPNSWYFINGTFYNYLNPSGVEVLANAGGCDSIVYIDLDYSIPTSYEIFDSTLCENSTDSYVVNNTIYNILNATGIEEMVSIDGCDSIIEVNLQILPISSFDFEVELCQGSDSTIIINDNAYNLSNPIGQEILTNEVGCDSIIDIRIIPLSPLETTLDTSVCEGDDFEIIINNTSYSLANRTGQEIISDHLGCDSIVNIEITEMSNEYTIIDTSICENDTPLITINNTIYNFENPSGQEFLSNTHGCDSIIEINIQPILLDTQFAYIEICQDAEFQFEENSYGIGNVFYETVSEEESCDNIIEYNVIEKEDVPSNIDTTLYLVLGENPNLDLNLLGIESIIWTPQEGLSCYDCLSPTPDPSFDIKTYQATILDNSFCTYSINVNIEYIQRPHLPNIFSPNGDQVNDFFTLFIPSSQYSSGIEIMDLQIYNRWGNLVKQVNKDILTPNYVLWDGTVNGTYASDGVYVYQFSIRFIDEVVYNFVGDISVLK